MVGKSTTHPYTVGMPKSSRPTPPDQDARIFRDSLVNHGQVQPLNQADQALSPGQTHVEALSSSGEPTLTRRRFSALPPPKESKRSQK